MDDREKLINILSKPIYPRIGANSAEVVADYLLDNDVKPVTHAYWVRYCDENGDLLFELCSNCRHTKESRWWEDGVYCPRCGAKMDGEKADE